MSATLTRQTLVLSLGAALMVMLAGCATYRPANLTFRPLPENIETQVVDDVTIRGAILTEAEAIERFGVNLADVRIQAIWVRVENNSPNTLRFLLTALDPEYRAPDEIAELFRPLFGDEGGDELTRTLRESAINVLTCAGCVNEGYVFTPLREGGRYVSAHLLGKNRMYDAGFALTVPDGNFDYEQVHPKNIYGDGELPDLTLQQAIVELGRLPCCVANDSGEHRGDPVNLIFRGDRDHVMAALARAGWSDTHRISVDTVVRLVTSTVMGTPYAVAPISPLYFWERPQDLALQRARNTIIQRNHMRLWLAPWTIEGESVWVGQVSRDIAVKATTLSSTFTTHVIDPDIDEAREHLFQSLLVAGAIERYGFVFTGRPVSEEAPRLNLTDDPYFTDGRSLYADVVEGISVPPAKAERLVLD